MTDFANISDNRNIPFTGNTTTENGLGLSNPDSVLSGTLRGNQFVGGPGAQIDSANNRFVLGDITLDGTTGQINVGSTVVIDGVRERITFSNNTQQIINIGSSSTDSSNALTVSDSTGTRRLMAGQFPDGTIKVKLSQPTFDVGTAQDVNLIWSSDFNNFKIVMTGTISIGSASITSTGSSRYDTTSVTATLTHNLGYRPAFLLYGLGSDGRQQPPHTEFLVTAGGAGSWFSSYAAADETTLVITIELLVGSTPSFGAVATSNATTFKYYLLRETSS